MPTLDSTRPNGGVGEPARVSVVVRSMDRPSLAATLASIAAQTYHSIEVVVVNARGGMHSPLPAQCGGAALQLVNADGAALPRAAAANAGLSALHGQMVLFLDEDDCVFAHHLHKLVAALDDNPAAVAAYSDVDHGRMLATGWQSSHCFAAEFDRHRLCFENYLPIHAVLFRRLSVDTQPPCRFDEQFSVFEDWDFWLQLAERGSFVHVPGISARYVATAQGTSGVFVSSTETATAQALLFAKWQRRRSAQDHAAFMKYAQSQFRRAAEGDALRARAASELSDARAELDSCKSVLGAREREIANLDAHIAGLSATLDARDVELKDYAALAADLRTTVAARDVELKDYAALAADLRTTVAARDVELKDHAALAAGLRQSLAACEAELAAQATHNTALDHVITALNAELAAIKPELARLSEQGPLSAFASALRRKKSAP